PFTGRTLGEVELDHRSGAPDLVTLGEEERKALQLALSKDPGRRFASCCEFVYALERAVLQLVAPAKPPRSEPQIQLLVGTAPEQGRETVVAREARELGYAPREGLAPAPLAPAAPPSTPAWARPAKGGSRRLTAFVLVPVALLLAAAWLLGPAVW